MNNQTTFPSTGTSYREQVGRSVLEERVNGQIDDASKGFRRRIPIQRLRDWIGISRQEEHLRVEWLCLSLTITERMRPVFDGCTECCANERLLYLNSHILFDEKEGND
jgi:hypothetical protein